MTHGLLVSPFSTAFLATRPAAIITLGFEVFVQLVIAATTTAPWSTCEAHAGACTATAAAAPPPPPFFFGSASIAASDAPNDVLASLSGTRSCGRRGPARLGSTVARSSSIALV